MLNLSNIHPIGIGTWAISGGPVDRLTKGDKKVAALQHSLKKGQNHIDTAEMYGFGYSEKIVGIAIKKLDRKKIFVATKVWRNNATSDRIPKSVEASLSRLNTKQVDLLYIHACWDESKIPEYVKGLNKAQDAGFTKSIGVSNFNLEQLKKAVSITKHPIVALQNHYNVMHQHEVDDDMKKFCKKHKITIVAYSPLENCNKSKEVLRIAKKYKKTPAQIALNWLINQDNVVTIPKSTNNKHIDENLGTMDFEITKSDIIRLNKLS